MASVRTFFIGLLGGAGVLHFVAPRFFDDIIPAALPGSPRAYTYASGVAELGCAAGFAAPSPKAHRWAGLSTALLMAAVWPANFEMSRQFHASDKPGWLTALVDLRLPLQLPLIAWGWQFWRGRRR